MAVKMERESLFHRKMIKKQQTWQNESLQIDISSSILCQLFFKLLIATAGF